VEVDSTLVSYLSTSGIYTLLLFVKNETTVTVGKLGKQQFPRGYYTYTGSALGKGASLKNRLARHLKKQKQMFWHIDYLLADKNVSVKAIIAVETRKKMECDINSYLKNMFDPKILVKGFGSSDCKKKCGSHLLFFSKNVETEKFIQEFYEGLRKLQGILSLILIN
jgi:Uri superfamily endonuclease